MPTSWRQACVWHAGLLMGAQRVVLRLRNTLILVEQQSCSVYDRLGSSQEPYANRSTSGEA
jgi:hypothetical protein